MAFTYSAGLADPISRVRQRIGDTVDAGHLVEDETITYYLTSKTELGAAAQLARDLAARFAGSVDLDVDGESAKRSQRFKQFSELAVRLEAELASEASKVEASDGFDFSGVAVYGTTAQEVIDAREDCTAATNAPLRWG